MIYKSVLSNMPIVLNFNFQCKILLSFFTLYIDILGYLRNPHQFFHNSWARPWENVSYSICEQQRRRLACASAQSDQHLYCSLPRQYGTYTCLIQNFKTLANLCRWAGRFESYLVANPRRHVFSWWGSVPTQFKDCTFISEKSIFEPRHVKTCLREFPTRPDTNRAAQPQKPARVLKF